MKLTPIKLALIETGTPAPPLRARFGGYYDMFHQAFATESPEIELVNFPVYQDLVFPDVTQFDGVLISGSPYGVYEDHDFIPPLKDFIRREMTCGTAIAGICFGHQIMAEAMGGKVEKSDKGWGVGVHTYALSKDVTQSEGITQKNSLFTNIFKDYDTLSCLLSHQDQVVSLSPSIQRLGGSEFCPNGILEYGKGNGVSFQMHPEFTLEFAEALLDSRRDRIDSITVSDAQVSFGTVSDRTAMITMLRRFFKNHRAACNNDRGISKDSIGVMPAKEKHDV